MKIHWWNLKIFFSRTTEPISTKLGTKHPWMKGIQICSNEGPCFFSRGDNYKMVKIHWRNLKIFFSWTTEPISTKLGTKYPRVRGIQDSSNEKTIDSHKVNNVIFSSLNQRYVYWFELFFSGERCGPWASCYFTSSPVSLGLNSYTHASWRKHVHMKINLCIHM